MRTTTSEIVDKFWSMVETFEKKHKFRFKSVNIELKRPHRKAQNGSGQKKTSKVILVTSKPKKRLNK